MPKTFHLAHTFQYISHYIPSKQINKITSFKFHVTFLTSFTEKPLFVNCSFQSEKIRKNMTVFFRLWLKKQRELIGSKFLNNWLLFPYYTKNIQVFVFSILNILWKCLFLSKHLININCSSRTIIFFTIFIYLFKKNSDWKQAVLCNEFQSIYFAYLNIHIDVHSHSTICMIWKWMLPLTFPLILLISRIFSNLYIIHS